MARVRLIRGTFCALAASCAVAAVPGTGAASNSIAQQDQALSGRLSNERTVTYWAYSVQATAIRSRPTRKARVVGRTQLWTEDGLAEDYLVLAQKVFPRETWFQIRIPGRPNGRIGWVPEEALGDLQINREHLVIDRRHLRITLFVNGRRRFSAPVGIGTPSTPTPAGHFWVREKLLVDPPDPVYGPYALGTSDYSTLSEWPRGGIVGIHGTDSPELIPGRPSHGCVRMRDPDVGRLWHLVSVGTPVTIS